MLLKTRRFQDARKVSDESFHLIGHDRGRFCADEALDIFLKLRIPDPHPFSYRI